MATLQQREVLQIFVQFLREIAWGVGIFKQGRVEQAAHPASNKNPVPQTPSLWSPQELLEQATPKQAIGVNLTDG
jgi:hypothetical protein